MNKKSDEPKIKIAYAIRNFGYLYLMFALGCVVWKLFESHGIINNSVILPFIGLVCLSFPVFKFSRLLKNNNGKISKLQAILSIADLDIAFCLFFLCGCLLERDLNNALLLVMLTFLFYGLRCFFVHRFSNE